MSDKVDPINDNVEISGSSPKRTRPTDRQMGLETHEFFEKNNKEEKKQKQHA